MLIKFPLDDDGETPIVYLETGNISEIIISPDNLSQRDPDTMMTRGTAIVLARMSNGAQHRILASDEEYNIGGFLEHVAEIVDTINSVSGSVGCCRK